MSTGLARTDIQAVTNAAVEVMAFSFFAQALGMMAATAIPGKALSKQKPADRAIADMQETFGKNIVDRAISMSKTDDIYDIARNVDILMVEDMVNKYGEWQTDLALQTAPPGDMKRAYEIAKSLGQKHVTPASTPQQVSNAVNRGIYVGKSKGKKVVDTWTGRTYQSEYKAGLDLAAEFGEPAGKHTWFAIVRKINKDPKYAHMKGRLKY